MAFLNSAVLSLTQLPAIKIEQPFILRLGGGWGGCFQIEYGEGVMRIQ